MKIVTGLYVLSILFFSCDDFFSHKNDSVPLQTVNSHPGGPRHKNINILNLRKEKINLKPAINGVTISELYAGKSDFAGKNVRLKGIVTRFSGDILKTNWVHIQDGTEYMGKFDMTVTTASKLKAGDTVIFEGKIAIDKDYGYGYYYGVIMENAVIVR